MIDRRFSNSGFKNGNYKGTQNVSGDYYGNLRRRSKNYGVELALSIDDLQAIYDSQAGKCAYTGEDLGDQASLDRIDPNYGYVQENVQWVLTEVNLMKRLMSDEEFVAMAKKIAAYRK